MLNLIITGCKTDFPPCITSHNIHTFSTYVKLAVCRYTKHRFLLILLTIDKLIQQCRHIHIALISQDSMMTQNSLIYQTF